MQKKLIVITISLVAIVIPAFFSYKVTAKSISSELAHEIGRKLNPIIIDMRSKSLLRDQITTFAKQNNLDLESVCRTPQTVDLAAYVSSFEEIIIDSNHKLYLLNACAGGAYNTNVNAFIGSSKNGVEVVEPIVLERYDTETKNLIPERQTYLFGPRYIEHSQTLETFYKGRGLGDFGSQQKHVWDAAEQRFILMEWRFKGGEEMYEPGYVPVTVDQWPVIYQRMKR